PPEGMSVEPAPPAQALRRGRATSLERALVFLALLDQFNLREEKDDKAALYGCLLFSPGEKGPKLWACGVAVGKDAKDLSLFDPRMGIPLPGPGGKGVATLAQACQDASVLGQLKVDKLSYDITPELAKKSHVRAFCTLSALAPRMELLEERL